MKPKYKNILCYLLSLVIVTTAGYTAGRKVGYNQRVEDVVYSLYDLKEDINHDIINLLKAKYNLLKNQGIDESEPTYSISELYVADLETDSYVTFGENPVYAYRYWIVSNSEIPTNSPGSFSDAIYPNDNWPSYSIISANYYNTKNGCVVVNIPDSLKSKKLKPLEGITPLAYYLTDEEIDKGYLTESELEMVFIRINKEEFKLTLKENK